MPTRRAAFSLALFAAFTIAGCSSKEAPTPTTTIAPPPPAAGVAPPVVATVDTPTISGSGGARNTTPPITGNTGAGETPIGAPTATVAADGSLAPYAAALAIVQPDHFAVMKFDMAALRKSPLIASLPVDPQEMARGMPLAGDAAEMSEGLTGVESLWVSLGPPRGASPLPVSVAAFARCATPQAAQGVVESLQFDRHGHEQMEHHGNVYFKSKQADGPMWSVQESNLFVTSDENAMRNSLAAGGKIADAPLLKKLAPANLDAPLVVAGSFGPLKESVSMMAIEALQETPLSPELGKIPAQIDWAVISINPDAETMLDIDADMESPQCAENLKLSLDGLVSMARLLLQRQQAAAATAGERDPEADAAFGLLQAALGAITVAQQDRHVDASFNRFPELAKLPEMMKSQVERARAVQFMNNARMLGLAAHNHQSATRNWPADLKNAEGKPLLSWRYQVLPYVEGMNLYEQMQPGEAWDSPSNEPFAEQMPAIFTSPSATEPNRTTWRMLADHPSRIMFLDAGIGTDITWSLPDGFRFDADNPGVTLGEEPPGGHIVVNADGSVERLPQADLIAKLSGKPAGDPAVGPPVDGPLAGQEPRFWQSGQRKIKAVLMGVKDGQVTLKRTDTKRELTVPLEKLSAEDQEYIRSLNLPN